jgi:hypothetical protein
VWESVCRVAFKTIFDDTISLEKVTHKEESTGTDRITSNTTKLTTLTEIPTVTDLVGVLVDMTDNTTLAMPAIESEAEITTTSTTLEQSTGSNNRKKRRRTTRQNALQIEPSMTEQQVIINTKEHKVSNYESFYQLLDDIVSARTIIRCNINT